MKPGRRIALGSGLPAVAAALALVALIAAPVLAAEVSVSIAGKAFDPATITVQQGDTVTWTVTESIAEPHSVTSGTAADAGKVFDSGINLEADGDAFEWTFDQPGDYPYFCSVHPVEMTGTVVVLAAGAGAEQEVGIPAERRLLAGGILVIAIALMFAGAWLWRRMNPA